ncbi:hypothetical protein ACFPL7_06900 [Dongia soli]|uniref:Uncharacterized protein n=1 Tax=Dongia soli TaxID=600628 RepID=A0ABU5E8I3_9PROT|nr:hypothetical protein [Dongia soli]MDY0882670.1 hypothetical protein [Dongia soli]
MTETVIQHGEGQLGPVDLHQTIGELAEMIDVATVLAHRGEQVELDLLTMRVAVLCDAIAGADRNEMQAFRPDLEDMLVHLDLLENAVRRQRVHLALNLESADRRLRAQLAYGQGQAPSPTQSLGVPQPSNPGGTQDSE